MALSFVGSDGDFRLGHAERVSGLYFPLCAEGGLKSCVTPRLGGDCKLGQESFVLRPVSAQDLEDCMESRNFWCRLADGRCRSMTGFDAWRLAEPAELTVEAGMLWHRLRVSDAAFPLESRVTSWIAPSMPLTEITHVVIRNCGTGPVCFTPTAAAPLYGRSADNLRDHRHVTSLLHRARCVDNGVILRPTWSFDERGHRPNSNSYFVLGMDGSGAAPREFCMDRLEYTGEGGSLLRPEWVVDERPGVPPGARLEGRETVGALRFAPVTLQPGEEAEFWLLIGMAQDGTEPVLPHVAELSRSLDETRLWWREAAPLRFESGRRDFDLLLRWVGVQPVLRRIFGCSFLPHHDYGRGGRGWRDLWQDSLGLLLSGEDGLRSQLAAYCGGMRTDGTNATIIGERPGEFRADRNDIVRVWMDHAFWPVLTICEYIDRTGDLPFLLEEAPYFSDGLVMRGTQRMPEPVKEAPGTVAEHLVISQLAAVRETGEHGALRLRGADWNDALDMAPTRGESVAFSFAYCLSLGRLSDMLDALSERGVTALGLPRRVRLLLGEGARLEDYCRACASGTGAEKESFQTCDISAALRREAGKLGARLRAQEWLQAGEDGWFNSYYDEAGERAECAEPGSERMMLTGQVFALMSSVSDDEQAAQLVRAARRLLFDKNLGGYRLNTDFGDRPNRLGRMFAFAYGTKENGAVFSHMAVMYACALYERGFVHEGFEALSALFEHALDFETSRIYPGIPEYFEPDGRGAYHYLTGAGAWTLRAVVGQMYGIRGRLGAMCIEPKLLARQFDRNKTASVRLRFGGLSWTVSYFDPLGLDYGQYRPELVLDGMPLPGNTVPRRFMDEAAPGSEHRLEVFLKEK